MSNTPRTLCANNYRNRQELFQEQKRYTFLGIYSVYRPTTIITTTNCKLVLRKIQAITMCRKITAECITKTNQYSVQTIGVSEIERVCFSGTPCIDGVDRDGQLVSELASVGRRYLRITDLFGLLLQLRCDARLLAASICTVVGGWTITVHATNIDCRQSNYT